MSSDSFDIYEVWADLYHHAALSSEPRQTIIALLIEFEGEVYNRALNDVLLNLEHKPKTGNDLDIVRRMWLSSREIPVSGFQNNVLPFPDR